MKKISKQKMIDDKCMVTLFDDGHVHLDPQPLADKLHTIDLNAEEVETLIKFLSTQGWYGRINGKTAPLH